MIDGQKDYKAIVIETFLDGLYHRYGDDLYVIYMGDGSTASTITENWVKMKWQSKHYRHAWNAEWADKFKGVMDYENFIIDEAKPDLVFVFGWNEGDLYPFSSIAQQKSIPVFSVGRYA